jgi:hypothetical protein
MASTTLLNSRRTVTRDSARVDIASPHWPTPVEKNCLDWFRRVLILSRLERMFVSWSGRASVPMISSKG